MAYDEVIRKGWFGEEKVERLFAAVDWRIGRPNKDGKGNNQRRVYKIVKG